MTLKVYLDNKFVGILTRERNFFFLATKTYYKFQYHKHYVKSKEALPLSVHLPLRYAPFITCDQLHPFFDNLIPDGWLYDAQVKAILKIDSKPPQQQQQQARNKHEFKYKILTHFGHDLIGAVHFESLKEANKTTVQTLPFDLTYKLANELEEKTVQVTNRGTICGYQKKVLVMKTGEKFRLSGEKELSTHIGKFDADHLSEAISLEFISNLIVRIFLPDDKFCNMEIVKLDETQETILVIERFDRDPENENKRVHFEEMNQMFKRLNNERYQSNYEDVLKFLNNYDICAKSEAFVLYKRIVVSFLIGNTDLHLKNMALFHLANKKFSLTPNYDVVGVAHENRYVTLALGIDQKLVEIKDLKPFHLAFLASRISVTVDELKEFYESLANNIEKALEEIKKCQYGSEKLKESLFAFIQKTWKNTFLIEEILKIYEEIVKKRENPKTLVSEAIDEKIGSENAENNEKIVSEAVDDKIIPENDKIDSENAETIIKETENIQLEVDNLNL